MMSSLWGVMDSTRGERQCCIIFQVLKEATAWRAGILIALNRFLQETHGSKMAFLDGAPPERQAPLRKPP